MGLKLGDPQELADVADHTLLKSDQYGIETQLPAHGDRSHSAVEIGPIWDWNWSSSARTARPTARWNRTNMGLKPLS